MTYCKKCVMPNTKPDLFFDQAGVCDACLSAVKKETGIDWEARKKEFEAIIETYRSKDGSNYDCIIPVSGGKDSHYQVYVMKKVYGLNPLLVSFEQTHITELGRKNRENIRTFGCDFVYFKKNPDVYKKMAIEAFKRVGDNEWPNHIGIFTIPVRTAVQYNVPLIIWGENSQLEYGGPASATEKNYLDRRWLEEFGGLLGNRVDDMIGVGGITKKDLLAYSYPSDNELKRVGATGLFLGYYFKWDARKQNEIVKRYGFAVKEDGPVEGTYTNYENLDEGTVGVHDYLKFLKYGFCRATDHACLDIRNGRITREEGMELVRKYDGKYPYYGVKEFSEYSGMSKEEIDAVMDSFTNPQIFKKDSHGKFLRDIAGNLVKVNYDNESA
ncbi:MAG: N-acetyl sugar amidotransferase [bacterium]|nr:N-acetyl sugar amidotransferase [bacterium]